MRNLRGLNYQTAKRLEILVIVTSLLICITVGCSEEKQQQNVVIQKDESYFSDFSAEGDTVTIKCMVSLSNVGEQDVNIQIIGAFDDEVQIGLLKENELKGYFTDEQSDTLLIPARSDVDNVEVQFKGEFGGVERRRNRLLPPLKIIELPEENEGE